MVVRPNAETEDVILLVRPAVDVGEVESGGAEKELRDLDPLIELLTLVASPSALVVDLALACRLCRSASESCILAATSFASNSSHVNSSATEVQPEGKLSVECFLTSSTWSKVMSSVYR